MSSIVDLCPDATAQLAVLAASPELAAGARRPLLGRADTLGLWSPKAKIAVSTAAASCCADPATLAEIARRDRRDQVLSAVVENPCAQLSAMWFLAMSSTLDTTQKGRAVRGRAAERAARMVAADLPALASTVESLHVVTDTTPDPRLPWLWRSVSTAVASALGAGAPLPEPAAVDGLSTTGALSEQLVSTLVNASLVEPCASAAVQLRAALRGTEHGVLVDAAVSRHLREGRDPEVVECCGAELAGLGFSEAVSVFAANPSPTAAALVAAAEPPRLLSPQLLSKVAGVCVDDRFPSGVAASLPATPATLVRALVDARVPSQRWPLALTLGADASELTAGAVLDMVAASTT